MPPPRPALWNSKGVSRAPPEMQHWKSGHRSGNKTALSLSISVPSKSWRGTSQSEIKGWLSVSFAFLRWKSVTYVVISLQQGQFPMLEMNQTEIGRYIGKFVYTEIGGIPFRPAAIAGISYGQVIEFFWTKCNVSPRIPSRCRTIALLASLHFAGWKLGCF